MRDFKVSKEKKTKVKLMNKTARFMYARNKSLSCQVLKLPYKMGEVAMLILLPDEDDGLANLEKKISSDTIAKCSSEIQNEKVFVSLPKFKVNCQFNLNSVLMQLGIHDLFGQNADLSGITGNKDLFISDVIHQAYVDVNEEGTEAAAATAVMMSRCMALPSKPPPHFLADHPFFFVIQHCKTGAFLFVGKVEDPGSY